MAGLALVALPVGLLLTLTLWPTIRMVAATPTVEGSVSVSRYPAFVRENLPLPVLVLTAGLTQVSDHAVEAARDLGARPLRIL